MSGLIETKTVHLFHFDVTLCVNIALHNFICIYLLYTLYLRRSPLAGKIQPGGQMHPINTDFQGSEGGRIAL